MTKLVKSINETTANLKHPLNNNPTIPVVPDSFSRDGRNNEIVIVKKFLTGSKQIKDGNRTPRPAINSKSTELIPNNAALSLKGVTERLERVVN
jgi:hypothetical protein